MPTVLIPTAYRGPTGGEAEVPVEGATALACLEAVEAEYPGFLALVVEDGSESEAIESARALGARIIHLSVPDGAPAGIFELVAEDDAEVAPPERPGLAEPDDVALVLHTSGTTSRPKIVPLLHRNVCASAKNIRTTLRLEPGDTCLNVMPLFHIHGLMAPVLSSLSAGASVVCTPGFNALKFFGWMDEVRPSWYSACTPTSRRPVWHGCWRSSHRSR